MQSNIESNIEWIIFWQNSKIELNQIGYRTPLVCGQDSVGWTNASGSEITGFLKVELLKHKGVNVFMVILLLWTPAHCSMKSQAGPMMLSGLFSHARGGKRGGQWQTYFPWISNCNQTLLNCSTQQFLIIVQGLTHSKAMKSRADINVKMFWTCKIFNPLGPVPPSGRRT